MPIPIPTGAEARTLLHHLLAYGDIVGTDTAGRNIIQLAVSEWLLEKLLMFDADAAELEGGDDEPDADDEVDGAPVVLELARPKVIRRRRAMAT